MFKFIRELFYADKVEPVVVVASNENDVEKEIVFPDGEPLKYTEKYNGDLYFLCESVPYRLTLPKFKEWEPPMTELFLLLLKDRKNWKESDATINTGYETTYMHNALNIKIYKKIQAGRGVKYKAEGLQIDNSQIATVFTALSLYEQTEKMQRVHRINRLRSKRIENEKRLADAARINNYLKEIGKC